MTSRTHNEFLDAGDSDSDNADAYDSNAEDLQKGGRTSKRRKVDEKIGTTLDKSFERETPEKLIEPATEARKNDPQHIEDDSVMPGLSRPITKKNLIATAAAVKRSGVVYISRIPPFMKPTKLRSLLEPYGAINRLFLTPEDPSAHARRVRHGGNKKRSFIDGWVEFVNKSEAKAACELLNARTIGGKKGTYYRDDVWNMLYLKGFKWNNLTAQIAAENAERASRMRAEISKSTKENKEFVKNIERAKMLEGMESKNAIKKKNNTEKNGGDKDIERRKERPRSFKQAAVASKPTLEIDSEQVKRVLSKIL
ncbi:BgTH12-00215 [Blumeria graminis f. sp. triticale]|uniref:18S rRNA factor 2 n=3 Tax=Blumeria graminis TaxID=34373 RepID=A0A381LCD8_BLUGR|nr:hypothetical protein BGT96224_3414 [Blumeria graminis f. sp. tritici 96224]CAD6504710.1 BgTH12-00215 [Blumeria graminis f. sp. triticale]VDB92753.1 Bgt-3414 [Blumeria graminis f. sp. tritici]